MTDQEQKAMEMALEALESAADNESKFNEYRKAAAALRQALADQKLADAFAEDFPNTWGKKKHTAPPSKPEQALDYGIDRGAWSDVPDATKWVDELRGDDEPEQEPVSHWDGSAPLVIEPHPLFKKREWVSLTDEELYDVAEKSEFGYTNLARAIEAALKEKNNV